MGLSIEGIALFKYEGLTRREACPSNEFEKRNSFEGQPHSFFFVGGSRDYRLTLAPKTGANTSICFLLTYGHGIGEISSWPISGGVPVPYS